MQWLTSEAPRPLLVTMILTGSTLNLETGPKNCDCILFNGSKALERVKLRGAFNKFPDIFVQAFKIVVDSW